MEKDLNFEQAMSKLEKIATELENAEKRITILLKDGEEIKEENFVQEEE